MKFKIRDLIFFCVGCVIGCLIAATFSLFEGGSCTHAVQADPFKIQKQAAITENVFRQEVQALQTKNKELDKALVEKNTALKKAKEKVLILQSRVKKLAETDYAAINASATETVDSLPSIDNCDELKTEVLELITESQAKDSIADAVTDNLQHQIKNKDSTIQLQQMQHRELQQSFEQSLQQQQNLVSENKFLRKKIKRKRFGNKVLSAATLILSGIAVKNLIH